MKETFKWITLIAPTIGLLIGIIFVAVGATMAGSGMLKLAFQKQLSSPSYISCEPFDYPTEIETQKITRTKAEIQKCKTDRTAEEKARFVNDKIENVIDGSIFLLVGILFWSLFRKRKEQ